MKRNARSRNDWSRVCFGDVVLNSTAVSRDPEGEGFTRYIIGKHIDENRPRVESWGDVGDPDFGPRIRTIFLPGDIICTTRGPHLKVATVDFRGLGAHTNFVLRTRNPEVLLQPYLEALARSDSFQQHLAKHFRGSVNLFVNWSDAALYEFDLPPIEEQRRIVQIFNAYEGLRSSLLSADHGCRQVLDSYFHQVVTTASAKPTVSLTDLVSLQMGYAFSSRDYCDNGVQVLRIGNLFNGVFDLATDPVYVPSGHAAAFAGYLLRPGDVVMSMTGSRLTKNLGWAVEVPALALPLLLNQRVVRLTIGNPAYRNWIVGCLRTKPLRESLLRHSTATAQANISHKSLVDLRIPTPTADQLIEADEITKQCEMVVARISERNAHARRMLTTLTHAAGIS